MEEIKDDIDHQGTVYYSHSKLKNQSDCPARNLFGQLVKKGEIPEDPALPLVYGSAGHKEIEERLKHNTPRFKALEEYLDKELYSKFKPAQLEPLRKKMADKMDDLKWCMDRFEENFYPSLSDPNLGFDPQSGLEVKLQAPFRMGILTGVIDVLFPGGFMADWKTGSKIPHIDRLRRDQQAVLYYYLGKHHGFKNAGQFTYVYLKGVNYQMKEFEYKSGKNEGQKYWKADPDFPTSQWTYSFNILTDDDKLDRIMADRIEPLARQYEQGVVYKNESDMNCGTCSYRTACPDYKLPRKVDYIDLIAEDYKDGKDD